MMTYEQTLTFKQKELKGMRMMQTWNMVGMRENWDDEGIIELFKEFSCRA